ncbi:MAG TPA: hypothetical protein VHU43_05095 [Steroidobacteraceae bacterium]|jgi:hypothetical protein|nr:hypothetical protein [Steroidobacteraceae bacterium]
MRKLKIIEHISLDGVIQVRGLGEDSDFPYGDWTAPYRSPAARKPRMGPVREPWAGHRRGRFFTEGTSPRSFELASTQVLSSGLVVNAYKSAGPLKNQPQE